MLACPKRSETILGCISAISIPYAVALALKYGNVELKHFTLEYMNNPELLELMQKITVEETEESNSLYPEALANRVEIVTRSGGKLSELVRHHRGHQRNPLSDEEIDQKFYSLNGDLLAPARCKELLSLLWKLEEVDNVAKITELLTI